MRNRLRPRPKLPLWHNLRCRSRNELPLPEVFLTGHDPTRDPTHITPDSKRSLGLNHLTSSWLTHSLFSKNAPTFPIHKLHCSDNRLPNRNSRNLHLAETF